MIAPVLGSARYPYPRTDPDLYATDRQRVAERMASSLLRGRHQREWAFLVTESLRIIDEHMLASCGALPVHTSTDVALPDPLGPRAEVSRISQ